MCNRKHLKNINTREADGGLMQRSRTRKTVSSPKIPVFLEKKPSFGETEKIDGIAISKNRVNIRFGTVDD
jgi:hypothetical protein